MSEKRSGAGEIAQGDLFVNENDSDFRDGAPSLCSTGGGVDRQCTDLGRVGGRHGEGGDFERGGEYLNNCATQNFSTLKPAPGEKKHGEPAPRDPRFTELEKIGLPAIWMRVAERVGFDAWLDIWRMLSNDESVRHDGGARMPKLRCYSAYSRYQRNRYIMSLAQQGMPPPVIQTALRNNLCERLDITNIQRITKRVKVKA